MTARDRQVEVAEGAARESLAVSPQTTLSLIRETVSAKLLLFILFVGAVGTALVVLAFRLPEAGVYGYLLREFGKSLLVTGLVTGSIKWYANVQGKRVTNLEESIREGKLFEAFNKAQHKIERLSENLAKSTADATERHVARFADSLTALRTAGIHEVYSNRKEAAQNISGVLKDPALESLDIIGISLNDFVGGEDRDGLSGAWQTIEKRVLDPLSSCPLNVRVLLLDPLCSGARLRSCAETFERGEAVAGRLKNDVEKALPVLLRLQQKKPDNSVSFEARLYRTAPILNLVRTQSSTFVQQYHFRPRHGGDPPIPLLQIDPTTSANAKLLHEELGFHFDWIWEHATVSLEAYDTEKSLGTDSALREANLVNAFYDERVAATRIRHMIAKTRKKLWIKGVTLHSFFQVGDLFSALWKAAERDGLDLRVLVIDPDCEQAKVRSLREYLMTHPQSGPRDFSDKVREQQPLVRQSQAARDNIRNLMTHTTAKARRFWSAPEAFLLLTDDSVLVEQYHYGTIQDTSDSGHAKSLPPRVLGKEVPLLEFRKPGNALESLKNPYALFSDHFEFVFTHCSHDYADEETPGASR